MGESVTQRFSTDRRSFLIGAAALAALAACGSDGDDGETEATTTSTAAPSANDVALLRTASSIEELEVALCQRGIDGLVKTPATVELLKTLQAEHKQHAAVVQGHTSRLGGEPFMQANPALQQQFGRVTDEGSLLRALYDLALAAAATYQAPVGSVADKRLNVVLMSVAGVEARQAALLGAMVNQPVAAASLATTEKAVAPGTGL